MRVRKPLAAVAALGVTAGLVGFMAPANAGSLPPAGDPVTVPLECFGDDNVLQGDGLGQTTSQGVLDFLGTLSDPPATPPNSLDINVVVTPFVPADLEPGNSSPIGFEGQTVLPDSLVAQAQAIGLTEINVSEISLAMVFTGSAEDGSVVGNPDPTTIQIPPAPELPTPPTFGPFTGDVTAGEETDILYTLGTVQFGVSLNLNGSPLQFGLNCNLPTGANPDSLVVAGTTVTGVAPSTTTTTAFVPVTTTSTVAPTTTAVSGTGTPRFTG